VTEGHDPGIGVARFKVVRKNDGRFGWEVINPYGTPLAESLLTFETEDEAVASAELVRQRARQLPIERS
jgi:hypothetical protein